MVLHFSNSHVDDDEFAEDYHDIFQILPRAVLHFSNSHVDIGAQEYFVPQPSLSYRFYGPMPAASFGRKESLICRSLAGRTAIKRFLVYHL